MADSIWHTDKFSYRRKFDQFGINRLANSALFNSKPFNVFVLRICAYNYFFLLCSQIIVIKTILMCLHPLLLFCFIINYNYTSLKIKNISQIEFYYSESSLCLFLSSFSSPVSREILKNKNYFVSVKRKTSRFSIK